MNLRQAIYALGDPLPAKRGMEPCPSARLAAMTRRAAHVGVAAVRRSSENVAEISTPPATTVVKLDQLTMTRPVSGSTSANSLSALSIASPLTSTRPLGLVAAGISYGPVHVWP